MTYEQGLKDGLVMATEELIRVLAVKAPEKTKTARMVLRTELMRFENEIAKFDIRADGHALESGEQKEVAF